MPPLLRVKDLTKIYPGVVANDSVSFDIFPGEIHSLLGENGAGKSTLVKMIYGIIQPDGGEMMLDTAPFQPARPSDARAHGVAVVFQHFSLFEAMTIGDNIALGLSQSMPKSDLNKLIIDVSVSYGLPLDPNCLVGDLSVGERQRVEIVRCLLQQPRLLVMDEPTSVLTPQEVSALFKTLRKLSDEGCAILYISHKLEEIRSLCSVVTVLRGGKVVGSCDPRKETARSLAEMMIGNSLKSAQAETLTFGKTRLAANDLCVQSDSKFGVDVKGISFELHASEILGIAGVAGNGQNELMRALTGEFLASRKDAVVMNGEPVGSMGPSLRRVRGMCFVPEKRLGHAAAPDMTLWENTVLSARTRMGLQKWGFLKLRETKRFAAEIIDAFAVKTGGVNHAAKSHSGGNLQKFIMGREILQRPNVLIVSQPTWGVDAGAAATIHQAIMDLAKAGAAILVISQDLDELMSISSSFAVISNGRLSKIYQSSNITAELVGRLMGDHMAKVGKEFNHD